MLRLPAPWPIAAVLVAALVGTTAALVPGCGPFCRDVQTRVLDFQCEDGANRFTGELHFDRSTTFHTFLSQQCIPSQADDVVDALVASVDWGTEAVFVAVGPPNIDGSRCVDERSLERAQVCSDGLRIYFTDVYGDADFGCAGPRWTVGFAMLRDDLRAALDAADEIDAEAQL